MSGPLSPEEASQLTACFEALAEPVFAYAMWATRWDRALAEDVVQQVFQVAAERWAKLCDLSSDQRLARLKGHRPAQGDRRLPAQPDRAGLPG